MKENKTNKTNCNIDTQTVYIEAKQILSKKQINTNLFLEDKEVIRTKKLEGKIKYTTVVK